MAQHDSKPILNLYITTVDYNRKDPVFWIQATTNMVKYKQKQRRFPRYYSELQKLDRHLVSTLDDVLLPVLPYCPQPHRDKHGALVPRQWWFNVHAAAIDYHPTTQYNQSSSSLSSSSSSSPIILASDRLMDTNNTDPYRNAAWDRNIQLWLLRITSHPRVIPNEGLREFVESEVGFRPQLKPTKRQKKLSGLDIKEQDMDQEFTLTLDQLEEFEHQLVNVQQKTQDQIMLHALSSDIWSDMASSWISYGGQEPHPLLFILYKRMAKGCQQLVDLEQSQRLLLTETIAGEIHYQIRNAEAAKASLQRRLNAFQDYLASRKHTESCLRHVDRLKSSSTIDRDKVNDVIADLEQARSDEQIYFQRHQRIERNLRDDLERRYKRDVSHDMITAIKEYARGQLHLERQKLDIWTSVYHHLV
ncbi:uncharacterized protein BX664DRAFT_332814 [Halteromyces radiatus]|uniref:uncharacterized protein n=1 Tax=Halteromyces radiatus TaxID=101107 RepID=UPI002220FA0B|nr:uncharacterized protein BX664DRAFT_332814 [Halteromyces radiatus]KAI8089359.1 hypothetical protein BX664DRAFT_332814 [Halteromyces radiatus]